MEQSRRSVVAWVISILIAIGVVFVAVCLYRRKRLQNIPFMFRRMSLSGMSTRSTRSVSIPSVHVASFVSSTGRSFINPAFNEDAERTQSFPSLPEEGEPPEQGDSKAENGGQSDSSRQPLEWEGTISFKDLKEVSDDSKKEEISIGIDEPIIEERTESGDHEVTDAGDHGVTVAGDHGVTDAAQENLLNIESDFSAEDSTAVVQDEDPLDLFAKSRIEIPENGNGDKETEEKLGTDQATD